MIVPFLILSLFLHQASYISSPLPKQRRKYYSQNNWYNNLACRRFYHYIHKKALECSISELWQCFQLLGSFHGKKYSIQLMSFFVCITKLHTTFQNLGSGSRSFVKYAQTFNVFLKTYGSFHGDFKKFRCISHLIILFMFEVHEVFLLILLPYRSIPYC